MLTLALASFTKLNHQLERALGPIWFIEPPVHSK
jgi:hypothetical protein